jgi:hypothetical protein
MDVGLLHTQPSPQRLRNHGLNRSTKQIACLLPASQPASTIKSTESGQSTCYLTGQIYLLPKQKTRFSNEESGF